LAAETKLVKCHGDVVGLRSITVNLAHGARSGSKNLAAAIAGELPLFPDDDSPTE
jgi:hypothetical protein